MAWDKTQPANNSALLSPPIRANWDALDLAVMAPLAAGGVGTLFIRAGTALFTPASWTLNPHLIPGSSNAYDLGSAAAQIRSLYAATSLVLGTDVILSRDGPGILAQKNGAATQELRIYEDAAKYLELRTQAGIQFITTQGGSWLIIGTSAAGRVQFQTNNVGRWMIHDSGHIYPAAHNTYDIGDPGGSVRALYVGSGITHNTGPAPATPPANTVITYAKTDKKLYFKDDAGVETPVGGTLAPAMVPLWLENARFPDGTANNLFPLPVERISTGTISGTVPKLVELVYQFHAAVATPEWLIWKGVTPVDYVASGAITLVLKWTMIAATTGNIRLRGALGAVVDGTTVATALNTPAETTSADQSVPTTLGVQKETRLVLTSTGVQPGAKFVCAATIIGGSASPATGDRVLESAHLEFARA